MTFPSGSQSEFDVLINMLLKGDEETLARIKAVTNEIKEQAIFRRREAEKTQQRSQEATKKILQDIKEQERADNELTKSIVRNSQLKIRELRAQAREIQARNRILLDTASDIDRFAKPAEKTQQRSQEATKKILPDIKEQERADNELTKSIVRNSQLKIREFRAQAREIQARNRILLDTASDIDRFAKPLAAFGLLTVGGIFAAANKYVKDAKEATQTTLEWKAAQESLNKSGERIGAVLAKEALPLLKEAAVVTQKIAGFLERNPEAADFALKAGLISLAVGTIGKAVSSGIRLYADFKMDAALTLQMTAAELQLKAAQTQLTASGIKSSSTGIDTNDLIKRLSSPAVILTLAASAFAAANFFDNQLKNLEVTLAKTGKTGAQTAFYLDLFVRGIIGMSSPLLGIVNNFKKVKDGLENLLGIGGGRGTDGAGIAAPNFLGGTQESQDKLLAAYEKYREEDLALVKKHYDDRNNIISDALSSISAENTRYTSTVNRINTNTNNQIVKATEAFDQANLQAEQDYQNNRADIIKSGNEDIQKLQEDSQERLKKIQQQYEDKAANARNRRDALGLIDARQERDRAVAEEKTGVRKEIIRRRQETAQRLQELDAQYQQEKERRVIDFQARIAELQQQRAVELQEAQAAHAEELKKIREQEAAKLKQVDEAFRAEQKHRQAALIAQIRDVDAALLGETNLRRDYQNRMLQDLNAFLASYRSGLATLGSGGIVATASGGVAPSSSSGTASPTWSIGGLFGTQDSGGYTPKGIYRMAWDGNTEFTLNGPSTKAMERIVGGRLNQANIMQAAMRGGNGQATLNYNARFDGEVTTAMRRAVKKDIDAAISEFVRSAL